MGVNDISGSTRITGLLGDPVGHTLSPAMHNAAFGELGLDYLYVPFRVTAADLPAAVAGLRALRFSGFNVTVPHKVSIIPLLDGLDPLAEKIGAVNTVVNRDGELRGYNTDADGFLRGLRDRGIEPGGKTVVVIGAGGAARAIAYVLARERARITILNRTEQAAENLADVLRDDLAAEVATGGLARESLAAALGSAEILVNATSVGMTPDSTVSPVPEDLIKPGHIVCDVVYSPVETRLLAAARAAGAVTVDGVDMLVYQGALAFEMWTGQPAPCDTMKSAILRRLEAA